MNIMETNQTTKWKKVKLFKFAIITILLILVLLEISFRVVFFFQNNHLHNSISIQGSPLQIPDDTLIFKNSPFYLDYYNRFQHNEEGMKSAPGDEFIPLKKPGDFWVLLTGGSAMEGMGSNRNGDWFDITGVDDHPYNLSISAYLQKKLQDQMPGRKVKVFNGAFSSSVLFQSYRRYLQLEKKLKPDWVISMDGMNDPSVLKNNETVEQYIQNDWDNFPQFHYPLKLIIPITSHSALFNFIKQKIFAFKHQLRANAAVKGNFPVRTKWANSQVPPVKPSILTADIKRAADRFSNMLLTYDSTLTAAHRKHLLLLQPHMFLRDTLQLTEVEKAVNHYYRSDDREKDKQAFLAEIYSRFSNDSAHTAIIPMTAVHHWNGFVFVDYCHFSDEATLKIANEIAAYMLSDGRKNIFKN
jgi:hypothetical protein